MTTSKIALVTVAFVIMSTAGYSAWGANPKAPTSACGGAALGLCTTPLFKSYVACIEGKWGIQNWDPKGPVLSKREFPASTAVLAVLLECEPIAITFGNKYGNRFANILQSIANRKVSERYETPPLTEPVGDVSSFLEYGERIKPADVKQGDLKDDRYRGFRRVIPIQNVM